jgi:hypothetical protein
MVFFMSSPPDCEGVVAALLPFFPPVSGSGRPRKAVASGLLAPQALLFMKFDVLRRAFSPGGATRQCNNNSVSVVNAECLFHFRF